MVIFTVRILSASLGVRIPEGWLCTMATATALRFMASAKISLGCLVYKADGGHMKVQKLSCSVEG